MWLLPCLMVVSHRLTSLDIFLGLPLKRHRNNETEMREEARAIETWWWPHTGTHGAVCIPALPYLLPCTSHSMERGTEAAK